MKVGDLVKLSAAHGVTKPALVVDLVDKKCWRTHTQGHRVNWDAIQPEPHAIVLIDGSKRTIPVVDLELMNETNSCD